MLLASFILSDDTKRSGSAISNSLVKIAGWYGKNHNRSLAYTIEQDLSSMADYLAAEGTTFNDLFETMGGHPTLLKLFLKRRVHLDTFVVMDIVLGFSRQWDKVLTDPLWESLSLKLRKYKPFLSISVPKYSKVMKEMFCESVTN